MKKNKKKEGSKECRKEIEKKERKKESKIIDQSRQFPLYKFHAAEFHYF
jgi:hypothetical protein